MIIDWQLVLIVGGGYFMFFWVMPMCGIPSTETCRRRWPQIPEEDLIPYWQAVCQVSACFHIAAVAACAFCYYVLIPAMEVAS